MFLALFMPVRRGTALLSPKPLEVAVRAAVLDRPVRRDGARQHLAQVPR
jgi:hypothetical protein